MTAGVVNASLEPILRVTLIGEGDRQEQIDAVVDTGYNGFGDRDPPPSSPGPGRFSLDPEEPVSVVVTRPESCPSERGAGFGAGGIGLGWTVPPPFPGSGAGAGGADR